MSKVNLKDYGTKREKIGIEDLEKDVAVLTLATVDEVDVEDEEQESGLRKSMVLSFDEIPNKVLWPNRTQIAALVIKLGDDTDHWIGEKVPVEKARVPFKGKMFDKVRVVAAAEWEQYLKSSKKRK